MTIAFQRGDLHEDNWLYQDSGIAFGTREKEEMLSQVLTVRNGELQPFAKRSRSHAYIFSPPCFINNVPLCGRKVIITLSFVVYVIIDEERVLFT